MSTISPNMNLVLSTIGVDSGLNWETNLNASLTSVDSHNHSAGQGVPIQPNGLNINSNLTFQTNQATNVGAVLFTNQSSLATLNALYVINGDLWYNDATSPVQLTLGGAVNATSSGIVSGSASAAFSGGVLIVDSASNTPANVQCGSVLLGNNVASSNFLTLAPPSSMASSFTVTLPSIPAAQSFLTIDTSGNIGAYANISGGITGSNIASATVTRGNLTSPGVQQSSPTTASTSTGNYVNTGAQLVITTTGNPVLIIVNAGEWFAGHTGTGALGMSVGIGINGSFYQTLNSAYIYDGFGSSTLDFSLSGSTMVVTGAGTYTFSIWIKSFSSSVTANMSGGFITAYETK